MFKYVLIKKCIIGYHSAGLDLFILDSCMKNVWIEESLVLFNVDKDSSNVKKYSTEYTEFNPKNPIKCRSIITWLLLQEPFWQLSKLQKVIYFTHMPTYR